MTPERYEKMQAAFLAACDCTASERERLLDTACQDDAELREAVLRLLEADEALGGILGTAHAPPGSSARPTAGAADEAHARAPVTAPLPERIGHYVIRGVLGEGGMGIVYRAAQDHPRREVALKVIRPGLTSRHMLRRLEHEAELLGRLQHPGIAQVFEAGTADTGQGVQPFFAMELVHCEPLTDYARQRALGTRARLELLVQACEAVEHAHQRGVIHRDLKPGNILVDDAGHLKILDFGVARATDSDVRTTTLQTDVRQLIGTIPYMSPEQVTGNPRDLDTRSDIYALGVVGFELLTGRLPHHVSDKTIPEAVRIIGEEEPTRLTSVSRAFRGDLDAMVSKALDRDRKRRYQSAAQFGADLRHYLRDEAITARPPSTWYQLCKFTRRNKVLVGGAAATFAALVVGIIGTATYAARAMRLLDRAQRAETDATQRAEETQQVAAFQASMLSDIDPKELGWIIRRESRAQVEAGLRRRWVAGADGEMRKMTADEVGAALAEYDAAAAPANPTDVARRVMHVGVLAPATAAAGAEFADQPQIRAQLLETLGKVHRSLGNYDLAEEHLRQALDTQRRLHDTDHPHVATSMNDLAELLQARGDYAAAEPLYRDALELRRRLHGDAHPDVARSLSNVANLLQAKGEYAAAEPLHREALARCRVALGEVHPEVATCMEQLAALLKRKGDLVAAEPLFREVLTLRRNVLGDEHPQVVRSIHNMAALLATKGDYAAAEPLYREALALSRNVLGDQHPNTILTLGNLALTICRRGDIAEGETLLREALALQRRSAGDERYLATVICNLAEILESRGDVTEVEALHREALALRRRVLGPDHPTLAYSLNGVGRIALQRGDLEEAEALFREALALRRHTAAPDHPTAASSLDGLAEVLQARGDTVGAEALFREALAIRLNALGPDHPSVADSLNRLARRAQERRDP